MQVAAAYLPDLRRGRASTRGGDLHQGQPVPANASVSAVPVESAGQATAPHTVHKPADVTLYSMHCRALRPVLAKWRYPEHRPDQSWHLSRHQYSQRVPEPLLAADIGSPAESFTRGVSLLIFAGLYGLCCWRALSSRARLQTPIGLIRWMALVWLLYCAIGTPWFWPWYTAIFFALFALLESTET